MLRRSKIRCRNAFAEADGVYNYQVYCLVHDGVNFSLATCKTCAELFFINRENPKTKDLNVSQIGMNQVCPVCNSKLGETLITYPEHFRDDNGLWKKITALTYIPPESENLVMEVWEVSPI